MLRKPPAAAMLPLLLVFVCGVAVGALAMSFVVHNSLHRPVNAAAAWNTTTVLKWKQELNLNDHQQHELESILDDFYKYYDNVLADGKDRILAILDEGQKRKFEQMIQKKRQP